MSDNKIESINQVFIASTKNINFLDLKGYLRTRISREARVFPKGTVFYLLTGIHHYEGEIGHTDPSLNCQFHYALFSSLAYYCGYLECQECQELSIKPCSSSSSVWTDMNYRAKVVPLYTLPSETSDSEEDNETYGLARISNQDLKWLCEDLMTENKPTALIFASCASMYSEITDILRSNGVIATMNISKDLYEITEGKMLCLDDQQTEVITSVRDVSCMSFSSYLTLFTMYLQFVMFS